MDGQYGASVERGKVIQVTEAGARIESLTRIGIVTPPLKTLSGGDVKVDDWVYFFLFEDGSGAILGAFESAL